jgi:hypothetical protein
VATVPDGIVGSLIARILRSPAVATSHGARVKTSGKPVWET